MNNSPIGVFDSGIGGLSVLSKLIKLLPNENYIYFADTANLPYGNKTKEELVHISYNIFNFFKSKNVKAVVMACNTTSATVYDIMKSKYDFQIYPIIQCAAKLISIENIDRIGVFATEATVNTHAYKSEIETNSYDSKVFEIACPTWVTMVENSQQHSDKSKKNIKMMLNFMLQNHVDKIILGCTHYPYLMDVLSLYAPEEMFIDPAIYFANYILQDLTSKNLLNTENSLSVPKFYASSNPKKFEQSSELFYKVSSVKKVEFSK